LLSDRYNLIVGEACSETVAVWATSILPFAASWAFYRGSLFNEIIDWGGQALNGPVNFVLPLLVSLASLDALAILRSRGGGASSSPLPSADLNLWPDEESPMPVLGREGSSSRGMMSIAKRSDHGLDSTLCACVAALPRCIGSSILVPKSQCCIPRTPNVYPSVVEQSVKTSSRDIYLTLAPSFCYCRFAEDVANHRSIVKPLPRGLQRAHRVVASILLVLVSALVAGSVTASLMCIGGHPNGLC